MEIVRGSSGSWTVTLLDDTATEITTYTGSETLDASVWPGDDVGELFAPTAAWLSSPAGTVTLSVSAAQSATLDPGSYSVSLSIDDTIVRVGRLLVLPGPGGTADAPPTYGSLDGMKRKSGENIADLMETSDLGNGKELLAEGRRAVDREVLSRARSIVETQAERHAPVETSDPIEITTGVDAGPGWGASTVPDTSVRDQLDDFRGYLEDDLLMVATPEDRAAVDACEHLALAELFGRQTGQGDADEKYRNLALRHRTLALRLLAGWTARIDTDSDGVADYELQPV